MTEPAPSRERVAAIDIGSNSIRLVVAEYDPDTGFEIVDEIYQLSLPESRQAAQLANAQLPSQALELLAVLGGSLGHLLLGRELSEL